MTSTWSFHYSYVAIVLYASIFHIPYRPCAAEEQPQSNNGFLKTTATTQVPKPTTTKYTIPSLVAIPIPKSTKGIAYAPPEYGLYNMVRVNYSKSCRPRKNALHPVEVSMYLDVFAINDIKERDHQIIITATLNMFWIDEFLVWNTTEFKNIDPMIFPTDDVWIPDFAMITADDMYELKLARGIMVNVYSDGTVNFCPKTAFKSTCQFDLTYFPFDYQRCTITFESWTYLPHAQFFNLLDPPINLGKFIPNEQWDLYGTSANAYINCPENATGSNCNAGASFSFYLTRKSQYYNLNIIVPAIIISIAELATFTIPIGEPMKIHISFTCLLAFSVFQTAINADMPRTSDHTPLLSMYIVLIMSYIAFAILGESFVFFSLALAKRKTPLPQIVKLCFIFIGRALFINREKVEDLADEVLEEIHEHDEEGADIAPRSLRAAIMKTAEFTSMEAKYGMNSGAPENNGYDTMIASRPSALDEPAEITPDEHARDWFYVALVSSRLTSAIYLVLIALTPLFMFMATPAGQVIEHPQMGNLSVSL